MGYHEKPAVELIMLKGGKQSKKTPLNLVEICDYAKHNRWISLLVVWRYETFCAVNKVVWFKIYFFSEPVLAECQAQKRIGPLFIDRQHQNIYSTFTGLHHPFFIDLSKTTENTEIPFLTLSYDTDGRKNFYI